MAASTTRALERLLEQGVEAVAICFLWSFKNAGHERRMKEIVQARAPGLFVTASSDLVPKWGEYERTTASVLNAYIGPLTSAYLANIDQSLTGMGYAHPLQITSCAGGAVSVAGGSFRAVRTRFERNAATLSRLSGQTSYQETAR